MRHGKLGLEERYSENELPDQFMSGRNKRGSILREEAQHGH